MTDALDRRTWTAVVTEEGKKAWARLQALVPGLYAEEPQVQVPLPAAEPGEPGGALHRCRRS